jgi:excisionase family DNA binding protein
MRGKAQFQIDQMGKGDPRLPQLFRTLRTALDLLEDIATYPHKEPERAPEPVRSPPPVLQPRESKLAYSIKEVRSLTGLSNATIYAAIKQGQLRSTKAGGRTLILAHDLQAWMDSWTRR